MLAAGVGCGCGCGCGFGLGGRSGAGAGGLAELAVGRAAQTRLRRSAGGAPRHDRSRRAQHPLPTAPPPPPRPTHPQGWGENDRGVSYTFGPDCVSDFLQKHDLDLVCRAHQVVEEGYEFFAKRQLVTIFSAPNYCGEFENAGAMMSVDDTLMCSFQVRRGWWGVGLTRGVKGFGCGCVRADCKTRSESGQPTLPHMGNYARTTITTATDLEAGGEEAEVAVWRLLIDLCCYWGVGTHVKQQRQSTGEGAGSARPAAGG